MSSRVRKGQSGAVQKRSGAQVPGWGGQGSGAGLQAAQGRVLGVAGCKGEEHRQAEGCWVSSRVRRECRSLDTRIPPDEPHSSPSYR